MSAADFALYRNEIELCECAQCRAVGHAALDVIDQITPGRPRYRAALTTLLDALRCGVHRRMSLAERAAEARTEKAARIAQAKAEGASAALLAALERGYTKYSGFMRDGIGAAMTPGGVSPQIRPAHKERKAP